MNHTIPFIWQHLISSRSRRASLLRWFRWQLGSRLLARPIVFDWIGNAKLVIEKGMTGATGNLYCGLHEFVDMAFLLHFLRPEDRFADVGANIGSYTVLASADVGATTCAFEPHPATHKRLERNISVNGIADRVRTVLGAVGQEQGLLRFTADLDTMNQIVGADYRGATIDVPVVRLDDALKDFPTIMRKVDVEGYETEVLEGSSRQLGCRSLKAILLETENPRIIEILQENGFERVSYDPFSRKFVEQGGKNEQNSLWIRDRSFCEDRIRSAPPVTVLGVTF